MASASTTTPASAPRGPAPAPGVDVGELERGLPAGRVKSITIGAVCKALVQEFPDISISKIRYLEDQKLLTPRRTPGGYRLYTQGDVARLRTILRMQRDEFLPLRVIRQELAAGRSGETPPPAGDGHPGPTTGAGAPRVARRASVTVRGDSGALYSLEEVVEETHADAKLVRELEEYGVVRGEQRGGARYYDETEREIVRAVAELARYGVGGRNLRTFRSSADREASLLQQILAPALRSRNPQRRKEALEALENLAAVTTNLRHLLLVRDLRKIVG
jgi:DNA-binding transcriptional MerR regulator